MLEFTGERVIPDHPETAELFREHLVRYLFARQFCSGRVVVDAGCGTGYGTDLLRQAGATRVIGIDISREAIAYARQRYASPLVPSEFFVADCTNLPFADGSVDVLVSFETIEHLQNPRAFMTEVDRVLAPEGLLVISTPNRATYPKGNPFHVREYDETEFTRFLQEFFQYVDVWYQDLGTVHRISPGHGVLPGANLAFGDQCLDLQTGPSASPAYFIALCAQVPLTSWVPSPALVTSERDLAFELTGAQAWALERDAETHRLGEIIRSLQDQIQALEATVAERTRWALERDAETHRLGEIIRSLQDQIRKTESSLEAVRTVEQAHLAALRQLTDSRWVRLGQSLHLAPLVTGHEDTGP